MEERQSGAGDICPTHIYWETGGVPFAHPVEVRSSNFKYSFVTETEEWQSGKRAHLSFPEEVLRAARLMADAAGLSPIALCVSGGVDSEILARSLRSLGVPFEMFFLNNWGLNENIFSSHVRPLAEELNVPLNVVDLSRDFFIEEYGPNCFFKYGCHFPTYLAMTFLFSKIPHNYFVVVGEGDLEKSGKAYGRLYTSVVGRMPLSSNSIPIMLNEIVYRLWARDHGRRGEFYFYSSTPGLIWSMWNHPQFEKQFPQFYTKRAIAADYPKLAVRAKSTNWENDPAGDRQRVLDSIRLKLKNRDDFDFWEKSIGCFAKIE